ncbi:hypothetical protein QMP26_24710 [Enterocloster clostridioformis]
MNLGILNNTLLSCKTKTTKKISGFSKAGLVANSLAIKSLISHSNDKNYTLKIDDEYQLEYELNKSLSKFKTEFRA